MDLTTATIEKKAESVDTPIFPLCTLILPRLSELQKKQLELEEEQHLNAVGKNSQRDLEQIQKGRGSMTQAARLMRASIVPAISEWLSKKYEYLMHHKRGKVGPGVAPFNKIRSWMTFEMMAHIGLSIVLDSLGRNGKLKTKTQAVAIKIGECLDHQAMLEYMSFVDPQYFKRLREWYLNDENRTYDRKITAMVHSLNKHEDMEWNGLSVQDHNALGSLILQGVMSLKEETDQHYIFETIKDWPSTKRGQKKHLVGYIGLSKHGMQWREQLQKMIDDQAFAIMPMLCPPRDWTNDTPGGYYTCPHPKYQNLVHNGNGTRLGSTAIEAINHLQRIPHKINKYIYELQVSLMPRSWKIGSFVTYELDSYVDENMPIKDSDYIATLDKESDEYKKLMRVFTEAYDKQKLTEKQAMSPRRVLCTAERFVDEPYFWLPWFVDWRGRMYCGCDSVNLQGADYQKALILAAAGDEVTDETYRNLLINLAITGEFATPNGKTNKLPYDERVAWAEEWIATGEIDAIVEDPMSNRFWMEAEEPWQFLATCEEIVALFRKKTRTKTHLYVARDMTCSGVQIMAALIQDEKAGIATNLVPQEDGKMRDAYEAVAVEARILLTTDWWMASQYEKREKRRQQWNAENPKRTPREYREGIEFDINRVDRKIAKLATMIAGYGGTFLSRSEGVYEACEEAKWEIHPADRTILANAIIEGMDIAFPKIKELNDWWTGVIKVAIQKVIENGEHALTWTTPQGGTVVHQVYREMLTQQVNTWAASGAHYAKLQKDSGSKAHLVYGYGDTKATKHATGGPANMVHSLDADILVGAIACSPREWSMYFVHDCAMTTATHIESLIKECRQSFYRTCSYDFLGSLVDRWDVETEMPEKGDLDLVDSLTAPYMFT